MKKPAAVIHRTIVTASEGFIGAVSKLVRLCGPRQYNFGSSHLRSSNLRSQIHFRALLLVTVCTFFYLGIPMARTQNASVDAPGRAGSHAKKKKYTSSTRWSLLKNSECI